MYPNVVSNLLYDALDDHGLLLLVYIVVQADRIAALLPSRLGIRPHRKPVTSLGCGLGRKLQVYDRFDDSLEPNWERELLAVSLTCVLNTERHRGKL